LLEVEAEGLVAVERDRGAVDGVGQPDAVVEDPRDGAADARVGLGEVDPAGQALDVEVGLLVQVAHDVGPGGAGCALR
jgi:hypothetical protein